MVTPYVYPRPTLKGIRFAPPQPNVVPVPQKKCAICGAAMIWILFESRWRCPRCGNLEVPQNLRT